MKSCIFILIFVLTIVCEGGGPQPTQVAAEQLIRTPERYDGKLISTIGYYTPEHHGAYLAADAKHDGGQMAIHLDFRHSFIAKKALKGVRYGYVKIIGTFQYREMNEKLSKDGTVSRITAGFGWMNIYDKQITNISRFENIPEPRRGNRK